MSVSIGTNCRGHARGLLPKSVILHSRTRTAHIAPYHDLILLDCLAEQACEPLQTSAGALFSSPCLSGQARPIPISQHGRHKHHLRDPSICPRKSRASRFSPFGRNNTLRPLASPILPLRWPPPRRTLPLHIQHLLQAALAGALDPRHL